MLPALSAKDLNDGRSQVLNVRRIKRINRHPAQSDEDSSPESISDTAKWLNWNADLDIPNHSEDDWEADNESDMELDNGSEDSDTPEVRNVSVSQNVPQLIWPIRWSKQQVEKPFLMVDRMQNRRNQEVKKK